LKDQLQEMKAKTSMESKYLKKDADVRVACTQKKCQQEEKRLEDEVMVRQHTWQSPCLTEYSIVWLY
jgi:hypothetical protein